MAAQSPAASPVETDTTLAGQRATSYDVARGAGVSQPTVSRCFQDDSAISPATRARVLEVARRLGYVPNALARGLITRRSNMIGVIATGYTLRGNPEAIHAVSEALAASGKQILLVTTEHDLPGLDHLRGMLEYPLDGLISCAQMAPATLRHIRGRGIAVVLYNRSAPRLPVDSVVTDHLGAAARVAASLHAAGHRRLLCVSGPPDAPVSRERTEGFLRELERLGTAGVPVLETDFSYDGGYRSFLAGLAEMQRPDAVFCANDQTAMGVMDACRFALGLSIPRDISVVGFDDVPEAGRPTYRLTTMHQDTVGMAHRAVEILLKRLEAPGGPATRARMPARFVVRDSARLC